MRRRTTEERYNDNLRKQKRTLEEFADYEFEWSRDLMLWYKVKKKEMPEDEYRACAFFQNREYRSKPGSLTLLYRAYSVCNKEMANVTRENAFDVLRYKYKLYAQVLKNGGF